MLTLLLMPTLESEERRAKSGKVPVLISRIVHLRWRRLLTFSPLRRVTFCQTRQKVTKKRWLLSSGPYAALRGPLATGLLPGGRAAGPIHGASALDGHPCPSPPSARPLLGLLKSRRSRSRSRAEQCRTVQNSAEQNRTVQFHFFISVDCTGR